MKSTTCSAFDCCGYFLSGAPTVESFAELPPRTCLPDFRDLLGIEKKGTDLVSVSGAGSLAVVNDPGDGSIRNSMLMKGRAYGMRSGKEKKAKKGQI
jgi:hypothetical protein